MKFDWAVQRTEKMNLVEKAREKSEHYGRIAMGRAEEQFNATLFDMLADRIEKLESERKEEK